MIKNSLFAFQCKNGRVDYTRSSKSKTTAMPIRHLPICQKLSVESACIYYPSNIIIGIFCGKKREPARLQYRKISGREMRKIVEEMRLEWLGNSLLCFLSFLLSLHCQIFRYSKVLTIEYRSLHSAAVTLQMNPLFTQTVLH